MKYNKIFIVATIFQLFYCAAMDTTLEPYFTAAQKQKRSLSFSRNKQNFVYPIIEYSAKKIHKTTSPEEPFNFDIFENTTDYHIIDLRYWPTPKPIKKITSTSPEANLTEPSPVGLTTYSVPVTKQSVGLFPLQASDESIQIQSIHSTVPSPLIPKEQISLKPKLPLRQTAQPKKNSNRQPISSPKKNMAQLTTQIAVSLEKKIYQMFGVTNRTDLIKEFFAIKLAMIAQDKNSMINYNSMQEVCYDPIYNIVYGPILKNSSYLYCLSTDKLKVALVPYNQLSSHPVYVEVIKK